MNVQEKTRANKVSDMYESNEVKAGEIISRGYLHYGYFDADNLYDPLWKGSERFTYITIAQTSVQAGQRFCDLGCGVGTPAIMLAQAKQCYVDGITISKHQQQAATLRAEDAGVSALVKFIVADALNLPVEDNTYDGGWFFESIFHMGHFPALREAHRVLKPGATLVIADLVASEKTTAEFIKFGKEELHSTYVSLAEYPKLLAETGFELLDLVDITEQVSVPFPAKFAEAFTNHKAEILDLVDEEAINRWLNIHEIISENLGYVLVKAKNLKDS